MFVVNMYLYAQTYRLPIIAVWAAHITVCIVTVHYILSTLLNYTQKTVPLVLGAIFDFELSWQLGGILLK